MGLVATQGRFLSLTARKSNLEMQGQIINQQRMALANRISALMIQAANVSGTEDTGIDAQTQALQQQDKILEMQLKQIDTQHQACQTEIDAVKKVIEKNIEGTFKTFG